MTTTKIANDKKLWVSDNGNVTCAKHAGVYLQIAIQYHPKRISHKTPLDTWSLYAEHLLGGLPCETCVDWATLELDAK